MEMTDAWTYNGFCRCCLVEGSFLSLESLQSQDRIEETFADMINKTFGIMMLPLPEPCDISKSTICDTCVNRLRDAIAFKNQVLTCEDIFLKWYNKVTCKDAAIKEEPLQIEALSDTLGETDFGDEATEQIWVECQRPKKEENNVSDTKSKTKKNKKIVATKRPSRKKYKCKLCGLKFVDEEYLNKHKCTNDLVNSNCCPICLKSFDNKPKLKKHLSTHCKQQKCPICEKSIKRYCLNSHMKLHGEPTFICDVCAKGFWQQSQLQRHSSTHTGIKPYSCEQCNKKFSRKYTLVVHRRRHRGEKPYKCDVCDKAFADPSARMVHKRLHTGSKPYTCSFCSLTFKHVGSLRRHERTHTGERPYSCKLCGKQFGSASAIKPHMRTHTGEKPYKCDQCDQAFSEKRSLARHMTVHTGVKAYTCKICSKQISCLWKHMKVVHSGEKPYACEVCDKRFADSAYLKMHVRTHTGERPFGCSRCGRRFTQSHVLKNHRCGFSEEAVKKVKSQNDLTLLNPN